MPSPHLSIPHVQESQAQKHVTINEAIDALDKAMQAELAHADTVSFDITAAEFTENFHHRLTGAFGADITVSVPATKRFFAVSNESGGGFNGIVQVTGGGGASVTVADGARRLLYADGTDVLAFS